MLKLIVKNIELKREDVERDSGEREVCHEVAAV